ncbi:MAG: nucleotidyl transferase AbiEii/AbiGii toxin family protein [Nitrosopumilus sp.]|nr:nucleotidyl transferase AbiEii/AbiGii toxin family protein [Nitrosopumilus sp.]
MAVRNIGERFPQLDIRGPHTPKNRDRNLDLLTYYCKYDSVFGERGEVKVEIFYGQDTGRAMDVQMPEYARGIGPVFTVRAYGAEHMIGVKMTTLALRTIGIPAKRGVDIPKHIYDIASLLKRSGASISIAAVADSLESAILEEISCVAEGRLRMDDVLDDLMKFPGDLLTNQVKLDTSHAGRLGTFSAKMLGSGYLRSDYIADMLLVRAAIGAALLVIDGSDAGNVQLEVDELLDGLDQMSEMSDVEKGAEHRALVRRYGRDSPVGVYMKRLSPEQAHVYAWLDRMGLPWRGGHPARRTT